MSAPVHPEFLLEDAFNNHSLIVDKTISANL